MSDYAFLRHLLGWVGCLLGWAISTSAAEYHFQFGNASQSVAGIQVSNVMPYGSETAWGFEGVSKVSFEPHSVSSDSPFLFSVKLPEGNYAVTVAFGSDQFDSVNTVKAELRRLMLERVPAKQSTTVTRTFIVNVRTPEIASDRSVRLKPRERQNEMVNWDERLTLEFNGERPALRSLQIVPTNVPTLYLTGDSTVCDQPREPWNSWGQMLPRFFGPGIAVANHAESGESIKSSLGARRFEKVLSLLKTNDWVAFQFGHNDMKDRATDALEVYRNNLTKLIHGVQLHGGHPLLITSMERKAGIESDTLAGYPEAMREVARSENVPLIDLHATSKVFYRALGPNLDLAFQDGTHHNNYGSYELARCIVADIRAHIPGLARYLARDAVTFDPATPDDPTRFEMVVSPGYSELKPEGN